MVANEKICPRCGRVFPASDAFCRNCGGGLKSGASNTGLRRRRPFLWIAITGTAISLVVIGSFFVFESRQSPLDQATQTTRNPRAEEPTVTQHESEADPPRSVDTPALGAITAYGLLKDPYSYAGKPTRLDFYREPLLFNGEVLRYRVCPQSFRNCNLVGLIGLRFDRMFAPRQALYDVMAADADQNGYGVKQGEILVNLPDGQYVPVENRDWIVIPEPPTQVVNVVGAMVIVPTVTFLRFADQRDVQREQTATQ